MIRLLKYLKGYQAEAILAPLFKIIEAVIELIVPLIVAYIVDVGLGGGDTVLVVWLSVALAGLGAVGLGFSLSCQYLASKSAVGWGCNIRRALFAHIGRLAPEDIDRLGSGTLVNRLTNDVAQTQQGFAMFLRLMLRAPFIAVGAVAMSIVVAPELWYVGVSATVLTMVALIVIMRVSVPKFGKVQERLDDVSQITNETIRGERVIRAFTGEERSEEKFGIAARAHRKAATGAAAVSCLLNPLATVVINLSVVLLLWAGGFAVDGGSVSQGDLIALINYMTQILYALIAVSTLLVLISKALSSAKRINAVFDLPEVKEGEGATPDFDAPLVEFRNASYSFGGAENAVEGLTFTVRRGETLGVIGTTGSGKSTMAGLLARFYRAGKGEVLLAGQDVGNYSDEQLCALVTYAPQKALLFSGTVRSNLAFGGESDDARMTEALKQTEAWGFVSGKDGLDTVVDQKGSNFSGGEKQRLSLARALLKDAPVLILDDAAAALDYVTEARVMKNLLRSAKDKAVVHISQRVGAIRHSDKILVLDGGKVVGLGTHDELLKTCELYGRLNNNG